MKVKGNFKKSCFVFQYYNKWLSLVACLMCIVIMFLISWLYSLVTFVIFIVLYLVVMYRNPSECHSQMSKPLSGSFW